MSAAEHPDVFILYRLVLDGYVTRCGLLRPPVRMLLNCPMVAYFHPGNHKFHVYYSLN